ncbi:hypothetical protein ACXYRQ_01600 [Mycoplasma sp. 394]
MKLIRLIKYSISSFIPVIAITTSCSKVESKKEEPKNLDISYDYDIFTVPYQYTNFINKLEALDANDYDFVIIKTSKIGITKKFTRQEFIKLQAKIKSNTLKFNLDTKSETLLTLDANNDKELKSIEKELQKFFNNYYVDINWFEDTLKNMIHDAGGGISGRISYQKAAQNNKLNEYNEVVSEIKNFFIKNANIKLADDLQITEINQNIKPGYSLKIKLKTSEKNYESNVIKIDFSKPKKDWNDARIIDENLRNTITKKMKIAINDYFERNENAKNFIKFIKLLILIDDRGIITSKISNSLSKFVWEMVSKLPFIKYVPFFLKYKLELITNSFVNRFINRFINIAIASLKNKIAAG